MKTYCKLLSLTLAVILLTGCRAKKKEHKSDESSPTIDTVMVSKVDEEKERALLETQRQDSLRQDSIRKHKEKILNAMPTVSMFGRNLNDRNGGDLTDVNKLRKKLVALGYEKVGKDKYVLNAGGEPNVTVDINYQEFEGEYNPEYDSYEGEGMSYAIKIRFSNEKDASEFYKKWVKANKCPWVSQSKSGKTVTLETYSD